MGADASRARIRRVAAACACAVAAVGVVHAATCDVPATGLPTVEVTDSVAPFGVYDQSDIDAALASCAPGCELRFLPQVYENVAIDVGAFPQGLALVGAGQGATVLRAPLYGVTGPWDYLIDIRVDAPDGLQIRNLTLDGRKGEQLPPPDDDCGTAYAQFIRQTYAIHVGNAPGSRDDGVIACVEIRDFLSISVLLVAATGWAVEGNWIHDIGCHDVDQPCGPEWAAWGCQIQPLRRTNGYGIYLATGVHDTTVAENFIEGLTKFAIVLEEGGPPPPTADCDTPGYPKDNLVRNNTMRSCANGVAINGACRTTVENNTVEDSIETGAEDIFVGFAYVCAAGGCQETLLVSNLAQGNQAGGFLVLGEGRVGLDGNLSGNNCVGTTVNVGDIDLAGGYYAFDVVVKDHIALAPTNCFAGVHVHGFEGATITGGTIPGGDPFGIRINSSRNVVVEDVQVEAGVGAQIGMGFGPGLENVYVQSTAAFIGFPQELEFEFGGLDDGDSVAYCRLEGLPPLPQCCTNLAGYDPICDSLAVCDPGPWVSSPGLVVARENGDALLSWSLPSGAESYDVMRGDLLALAGSGGDFSVAALDCLAHDLIGPPLVVAGDPEPGQGHWFAVRGRFCDHPGSYDTGSSSQTSTRDPGIEASGHGCE
jgi:hypothetical protein